MYQTFEVVLRAVPRQSFRARPKWESAPGAPCGLSATIVRTCDTALYVNVTFALSVGTVNVTFAPPGTPPSP